MESPHWALIDDLLRTLIVFYDQRFAVLVERREHSLERVKSINRLMELFHYDKIALDGIYRYEDEAAKSGLIYTSRPFTRLLKRSSIGINESLVAQT